jgi:CubicO group peptidase (beta-lactamase class C family)
MSQATNHKTKKWIIRSVIAVPVIILLSAAIYISFLLPIITGYAAKNLCSAVFVSGRNQADVESLDLNFSFIKYTKNRINYTDSSVTSRFLWGKSKAICRKGFGTTLVRKCKESDIRLIKFPSIPDPGYNRDSIPWPMGDLIPDTLTGINIQALDSISIGLVKNNEYGGNAFAFMVLHKGIPVAEAYKPQFSKSTRFLSWSMAKSFMNALIGVLVKEDNLDINKSPQLDSWKEDERKNITINDIMQMQSGLQWNEDYGNRSDVTVMLHCRKDMALFAYDRPSEFKAGTHWYYSSGSANIISYLIRQHFNNDSAYYAFPQTHLFYNIGITDAIIETDPSGTFVGSSYLYATARDYARFALLYQQDGVFNGKRLLPEGWVEYTRTPASASEKEYGSLFWLNGKRELLSAPQNTYMCEGHDGQEIIIIPDLELIIVVLGYSPKGSMNFDRLVADIIDTLKN